MVKDERYALPIIMMLLCSMTACDSCNQRKGGIGSGSALQVEAAQATIQSLLGEAAKRGTDFAIVEAGEINFLAVGYVTDAGKPQIAFFKKTGEKFLKDTDVEIQGSGVPEFSNAKATNLGGVRNINNYGAQEILVRTAGDCGQGSTFLGVVSRDGKEQWTRVFSGCEGTTADSKTAIESEMAPDGNEVIKLLSYDLEGGDFTLRKTEFLVWKEGSWRINKMRHLNVPGRPIAPGPIKK